MIKIEFRDRFLKIRTRSYKSRAAALIAVKRHLGPRPEVSGQYAWGDIATSAVGNRIRVVSGATAEELVVL